MIQIWLTTLAYYYFLFFFHLLLFIIFLKIYYHYLHNIFPQGIATKIKYNAVVLYPNILSTHLYNKQISNMQQLSRLLPNITKNDQNQQKTYRKLQLKQIFNTNNNRKSEYIKINQLYSRKNTQKIISININSLFSSRSIDDCSIKPILSTKQINKYNQNPKVCFNNNRSKFYKSKKYEIQKQQKIRTKTTNFAYKISSSTSDTVGINNQRTPKFLKIKQQQRCHLSKKITCHLQLQNFILLKKIGAGRFGKVFLVKQKQTGFICALKVFEKLTIQLHQNNKIYFNDNPYFENIDFIKWQLKNQAFLSHPNIIQIYGFFVDTKYFYVLMQYGSDGHLYQLSLNRKKPKQQQVSFVGRNLLKVAQYIHSHGIIHRDIKPQNIVITLGQVKVCDFGWSVKKTKQQLRSTYCGTPLYLSPQILTSHGYDEKVDIWAIGILVYEFYVGKAPFNIKLQEDLFKIITQEIIIPSEYQSSFEIKYFFSAILNKNPNQRLSSSQLLQCEFIKKYEAMETCQFLCS